LPFLILKQKSINCWQSLDLSAFNRKKNESSDKLSSRPKILVFKLALGQKKIIHENSG
jgi:hypothetical protein